MLMTLHSPGLLGIPWGVLSPAGVEVSSPAAKGYVQKRGAEEERRPSLVMWALPPLGKALFGQRPFPWHAWHHQPEYAPPLFGDPRAVSQEDVTHLQSESLHCNHRLTRSFQGWAAVSRPKRRKAKPTSSAAHGYEATLSQLQSLRPWAL